MREKALYVALIVGVVWISPAKAQSGDDLNGILHLTGKNTLDRAIGGPGDEAEINATTDGGNASVKISRSVSTPKNGNFNTLTLVASAPVDKSSNNTDLVNLGGFRNDFNFDLRYTWFKIGGELKNPLASKETAAKIDNICNELSRVFKAQTGSEEGLICDTDHVKTLLPSRYLEFKSLFFADDGWLVSAGIEPKVGYKKFSFLEAATLNKMSDSKQPLSIEAFFGGMPAHWNTLITGGFNYQQGFKDADSGTLCPPSSAGGPVACKTGPIGKPVSDDAELLYIELRRRIGSVGASLKFTYDFKQDLTGVDLPISFVKDKDGNLTGGVRAGWTKTGHWQAGIFAGTAFKLFDR
ncbi:MAG TPA: hypothetical protein VF173_37410 [Thermoanaerobaculia bacterium]|nr:hypothetical protein [Thermoanaerobaculia bacterium]